jgi:hypothetical protein
MTHTLNITRDDPIIHLKAYGGVRINGIEGTAVQCEIDAPQLATMIEEDGHVYITVNSSCRLAVPVNATIEIEKGMGSVKIRQIHNAIRIEKVLGNLVLDDIAEAEIGKVGGNFSVQHASAPVAVEKIGGTLVVHAAASFACEKVGGNVNVKDVQGDFRLGKAGGKFLAQNIGGKTDMERVGGSFSAQEITLASELRTGGAIRLTHVDFPKSTELRAGGEIKLQVAENFDGANFTFKSNNNAIRIDLRGDDLHIGEKYYDYRLGENPSRSLDVAAGGAITLTEVAAPEGDLVGSLEKYFEYEDSPLSEMIQERVSTATRRAEAKVRAAEVRLGQIRERLEKHRGFQVDVNFGEETGPAGEGSQPTPPVPPVTRPAGKKGATDEERLMILQMLQENKISVDEAEALFKAMES